MFCPPVSSGLPNQVWPGTGVDVFRDSAVLTRVAVVSTFSRLMNFERWYFRGAATPLGRSRFTLRYGEGAAASGPRGEAHRPVASAQSLESDADQFGESFIDRAVLTALDWTHYFELSSPQGYTSQVFTASLRPVLMKPDGIWVGDPMSVWVQFWQQAETLAQISWYIAAPPSQGLPSAFEVPADGAHFEPVDPADLPRPGWRYSGGFRPAPWPGTSMV